MAKPTIKKKAPPAKVAKTAKTAKRVLEQPKYKTLRMQKRIKHPSGPIVGSIRLMVGNIKHILKHKRLFLGISVVYFLLSFMLVGGLIGGTNLTDTKDVLKGIFSGTGADLTTGFTLLGFLISGGAGGKISESGGVYQTSLLVMMSLVVIWAVRQSYAKIKVTIKESFYKSMLPLIPFVLVLFVIGLQFVPLLIGSSLYSIVISQGIAATLIEKVLWSMLVLCLVVLTLYMVTSSVFALYIVTLPDITPMQALRSARELVRYRRWTIMRKVLFLPFCLFVMGAIIMLPILLYATSMAQWVFVFLSMFALVVTHGYMYRLYRELL